MFCFNNRMIWSFFFPLGTWWFFVCFRLWGLSHPTGFCPSFSCGDERLCVCVVAWRPYSLPLSLCWWLDTISLSFFVLIMEWYDHSYFPWWWTALFLLLGVGSSPPSGCWDNNSLFALKMNDFVCVLLLGACSLFLFWWWGASSLSLFVLFWWWNDTIILFLS